MVINFTEIIIRISIIYVLIILGLVLRLFLKDPDNSAIITYSTKLILNILFPFIVISSILNANFNSIFAIFLSIFFCLIVIFSAIFSVLLYSRIRSIPNQTLGSLFLAVSFPNSVFLPFPLILILIGPQGLITATLFAVTVIVIQNSLGSYLGIKYGSKDHSYGSLDFKKIIKKILIFPPTFSMLIGFFFKIVFDPDTFANFLSFLPFSTNQINFTINGINWISLILALLLIGLTFNLSFHSLNNRFLSFVSIFRLIIAPFFGILFLILIYFFIFPSEPVNVDFVVPLLIQAFSGPAIINIAFAKEFFLDVESESIYITILTLLSLLILPFLIISVFILI